MNILLMHKNTPVLLMDMNSEGNILSLGEKYNHELLPLSVQNDVYKVKKWLGERAIPKTRSGIAKDKYISEEKIENLQKCLRYKAERIEHLQINQSHNKITSQIKDH